MPTAGALGLVLALNFMARWPFRSVPFVRDEGEYVHLGREILRGAVPYLDVYNQKTPFLFYWMAGVIELFGPSIEAVRVTTTLYGTLTALFVFLLGRALFDTRAALVATTAFCVMTFDQCGIVHAASTEFFMLLWLAAGAWLWFVGARTGSGVRMVLAGICAGLAYQTKQTGAALLLFFGAEAAWRGLLASRDRAARVRVAAQVGLAGLGFGTVLAATLLFFASQGALAAHLEATWTHNLEYVGRRELELSQLPSRLGWALRLVARWDWGFWMLGGASLAALAIRASRTPAGGLWLLLATTLGAAVTAGKLYVHYYEPVIVPLALGVGSGSAWLLGAIAARRGLAERAALGALLLAPWVWPAYHGAATLWDPGATVARALEPLPPAAQAERVAAYVAERTAPDEPFLVVGSEPQLYFYAARPSSSRMAHTYLLTGPYSFAPEARARFIRELREDGPRYVVMVDVAVSLSEFPAGARRLAAETFAVLGEHYALERSYPASPTADASVTRRGSEGRLLVFRRKGSSP